MNNQYYQMPSASASQYPQYAPPDPLEQELTASYTEAIEKVNAALQNLSRAELQSLNESPDRLSALIKDSFLNQPMVQTMVHCREKVISQAEENLQFEPQLNETKQQVQLKYDELKELQHSYKDANKVYLQLCQKYNPQNIAQGLIDSVVQIDEESEKIAEAFLNREKDLDSFLEEYVRHRTLSHSQKTKHEKLSNQLEKLHKANYFQS